MLLPPSKVTRPKHSSKRRIDVVRASIAVLWVALVPSFFVLAGCAEEAGDPQAEEEAFQEEIDRLGTAGEEEIQEIDDERSVERRIKDATVAAKIQTALVEARELRSFDFDPVVVNGRVMLRGEVKTQDQRRRAAGVAEDVDGVRSVINEVSATDEPTPAEPRVSGRDSMIAGTDEAAEPEATTGSTDTAAASEPSQEPSQKDDSDNDAVYHTVRSGESLWTIANSNGVSINQIRQLNGLGSSNKIKPGQRLRVK